MLTELFETNVYHFPYLVTFDTPLHFNRALESSNQYQPYDPDSLVAIYYSRSSDVHDVPVAEGIVSADQYDPFEKPVGGIWKDNGSGNGLEDLYLQDLWRLANMEDIWIDNSRFWRYDPGQKLALLYAQPQCLVAPCDPSVVGSEIFDGKSDYRLQGYSPDWLPNKRTATDIFTRLSDQSATRLPDVTVTGDRVPSLLVPIGIGILFFLILKEDRR